MDIDLLDGIREPWICRATGDMTLCVLDAGGLRLFRIDMLRHRTMAAGDGGDRLARSYNDLTLLSYCPHILRQPAEAQVELPHPDAGVSSLPWALILSSSNGKICDSAGKTVADVIWTPGTRDSILASTDVVQAALPLLARYAF